MSENPPPDASVSDLPEPPSDGDSEQIEFAALVEAAEAEPAPDALTKAEKRDLDSKKSLVKRALKQGLEEQKTLHDTRLAYVGKLYWLILGWLVFTIVVIGASGWHPWAFTLSDNVIIALITSTTANVLGLFYVVAKWLYPATQAPRSN